MPIPASIAITRRIIPEITPIRISRKKKKIFDLERRLSDKLPFLYDRLMTVPLMFLISLSSTIGITIVVGIIIGDVIIVITDDIDDSDIESYAIPSASYCERAIDGTTRKQSTHPLKKKHINSF
jgi:hypothetical protein